MSTARETAPRNGSPFPRNDDPPLVRIHGLSHYFGEGETRAQVLNRYYRIVAEGSSVFRMLQHNQASVNSLAHAKNRSELFRERMDALVGVLTEENPPLESQVRAAVALASVSFGCMFYADRVERADTPADQGRQADRATHRRDAGCARIRRERDTDLGDASAGTSHQFAGRPDRRGWALAAHTARSARDDPHDHPTGRRDLRAHHRDRESRERVPGLELHPRLRPRYKR